MNKTSYHDGQDRRNLDKESLKRSFIDWLTYAVGKDPSHATPRDWFASIALSVRDRVVDNWMDTTRGHYAADQTRVYYLSLEFLIGRLLANNITNLGIQDAVREAMIDLGLDPEEVFKAEPDQALGNGGLGRLAACFMDSMATVGVAGYGYGIRYEYGMFQQQFERGYQVESPEDWLQYGNPWEFERPEVAYPIDFYGSVEAHTDADGKRHYQWVDTQRVVAMAYDTPVVGWGGRPVNTLRLWSARPTSGFDLGHFNSGNFMAAVEEQVMSENLSRVLYPNDSTPIGLELRFRQEYFFTSASLQDLLRRYLQDHEDWDALPSKVAIQLNDTHPAIAVPEMMRLLIDLHGLSWARAWDITTRTISYTNHTLLPEALETWPVPLVERVLPRHMQIIYEINAEFLKRVRQHPESDNAMLASLSLIDENGERRVRMGNLAFLGSHTVNGVSALHTDLMKRTVFRDMHRQFPTRIVNKTNGITPRRWLHQCNPPLSQLITDTLGDQWVADLEQLERLKPCIADSGFLDAYMAAKKANKQRLAAEIQSRIGLAVSPEAMFDVQIKRIHEYKRQFMNLIQTVALYNAMRDSPTASWVPRVKIIAGKAASAYHVAKMTLKLANDIARVVNQDPAVRDMLKLAVLPNYNVSLAEIIIPGADLSEQISTAGKEASGTGNMKFALNGALTIGTMDGANVEIREHVGDDNIFIFGLTADEVAELRQSGDYSPAAIIEADPSLRRALDMIASGVFSPDEPDRYRFMIDSLYHGDTWMTVADFASYEDAQRSVGTLFADQRRWMTKAAINTASCGWFSSDRTIREYAEEVWHAMPPVRAAAE